MSRIALIIVALSLQACGYLGNPDGFRATNLTHGQETQTKSAMTSWNIATGDNRHVELDDEGGSSIEIVNEIPNHPGSLGLNKHRLASIGGGRSRIFVLSTVTGDEFHNVVLHELGHHLGCRDNDDAGEVMDRYAADQSSELTADDIACATALEPI